MTFSYNNASSRRLDAKRKQWAAHLPQPHFSVLYEDEHIVAVAKDAGLLTLPDRFNHALPSLRALLAERYGEIFIVHRLDRETSGVLVACKTAEAHKILSEQFETRAVRKFYRAVVQGRVEQDEMSIDIPLIADPARAGLMAPSVRGKESLTILRVIQRFRMATLVECELVTGRQHQIRVHCSAVGHPLLIDPDYGGLAEFMLSSVKRKYVVGKHQIEKPLMRRVTLHAHSLEIQNPSRVEGETGALPGTLRFEAPYPKDFKALLQALEKYAPYRFGSAAAALQTRSLSDSRDDEPESDWRKYA